MKYVRGVVLAALLILKANIALPQQPNYHVYPHSLVDIPISLGASTIKTPFFTTAKTYYYLIMIQVEKTLPFDKTVCMLGVPYGNNFGISCGRGDPLLRGHWTVWDGETIAAHGDTSLFCGCDFTHDHILKNIGNFSAKAKASYVVTLELDGRAKVLDSLNPRLIVMKAD